MKEQQEVLQNTIKTLQEQMFNVSLDPFSRLEGRVEFASNSWI